MNGFKSIKGDDFLLKLCQNFKMSPLMGEWDVGEEPCLLVLFKIKGSRKVRTFTSGEEWKCNPLKDFLERITS